MNYFAIGHLQRRRRRADHGQPQPGEVQRLQVLPSTTPGRSPATTASRSSSERHGRQPAARRPQRTVSQPPTSCSTPTASTSSRFLRPPAPARAASRSWSTPPTAWASIYQPILRARWASSSCRSTSSSTAPSRTTRRIRSSSRTCATCSAKVLETGADLGVSFDGDADRAAFVDETRRSRSAATSRPRSSPASSSSREPGKHVLYDLRSSRAVAE